MRSRAVAAVWLTIAAQALLVGAASAGSTGAPASPQGWTVQRSGTAEDLAAVSFPDALHGHVVGRSGTILATSDGGRTWRRQLACMASSPCTASSRDRIRADLLGVAFVDTAHGWAVGAGGTILGTADGGAQWTQEIACAQTSAAIVRAYCTPLSADRVTKDLRGVSFVDASHGWAAGGGETILHTDDGGHTWVLQIACLWRPSGFTGPCPPRPPGTRPRDLNSVSFVDAHHGAAVGAAGYAFFTADGGATWTGGQSTAALDLHGVDTVVAGYSFRPMTLHAVGDGGTVLVSGAKGPTWYGTGGTNDFSGQGQPTTADLRSVSFTDRLNGWAVGAGGLIIATHDEGSSWNTEPSGTTEDLRGVAFADANHGAAVGASGTIVSFRSTPAGLAVTAVAPRQLPADGRLPVTITGRGFTGADEVSFGRAWARGYTVDSDTHITAVPPPLPNGTVHVTVSAHGMTSEVGAAEAVTFSPPGGGEWSHVESCPAKCNGAAIRLQDGRVLILGSRWGQAAPSTLAAIYDPASGSLRSAAPLHQARWDAAAAMLPDGRVVVAGGLTGVPGGGTDGTPSTEVFDPHSGSWSSTGSLHEARSEAAVALLPDGEVLVAGGNSADGKRVLASAEIYDPRSGTWRETAPMHHARAYATALLLRTGSVLVAGNLDTPEDGSAELYDPQGASWRNTSPMPLATSFPSLVLLGDGRVLESGGVINSANRPTLTVPYAQIYNPLTGVWQPTGPMLYPRVFHASATLPDGRVLVAGGVIQGSLYCPPCDPLSQAELYDPVSGAWRLVNPLDQPEEGPSLAVLANGSVLMAGSDGDVEVFTPAAAPSASPEGLPLWIVALSAAAIVSIVGAMFLLVRMRQRGPRHPSERRAPVASGGRGPGAPAPPKRE